MGAKVVLFFPAPLVERDYALEMPLAILAVAAPLHAAGYQVVLIDERLYDDPEAELLKAAQGAICVGVSTITGHQLKRAIYFSRLLKRELPGLPVIWGGYHPSLLPEQCASEPYVDAVVRGQGELTFQELVERLGRGDDFAGLLGVTYRDSEGGLVHNPDRPFADVCGFPPAPYELLEVERFFHLNGGRHALQYISSQGCPFKCSFCVEPGIYGRWSGRDAAQVAAEIAALDASYQLKHVTFSDPNFLASAKRAEEFCRLLLESGVKVSWSGAARADQLSKASPELLKLMKRSGCSQIGIGIESGSQSVLDLINKKTTAADAIESNRRLAEAGIQGCYAFMVGFPKQLKEAEGEIWQTLMLIKKIRRAHPGVMTITFYVTPYPATPLYEIARQLSLKVPESIEEWAEWESTSVNTPWITAAEKDLVERCNNFYFPFAYPNEQLKRRLALLKWKPFLYPLHLSARLRCRLNFYGLPWEWRLMQRLSKLKSFRRIGSQIGALRGSGKDVLTQSGTGV